MLLCWDVLPEACMQTIARVFDCDIFSHWGMTETCLGGGVDCCPDSGMHLREPDFFVEIINPATGKQVPDGVKGEIVISTLSRRAMPLIRYRTGDVGCIQAENCSCGLPLRRLGAVEGRLDDGITLPGSGNMTLNELNNIILPHADILDFSAEYTPEKMELSIALDIVPENLCGSNTPTMSCGIDCHTGNVAHNSLRQDIKTPVHTKIRGELTAYPKILQAVENHNLKITVRLANQDGQIHSGFGKRSIIIK